MATGGERGDEDYHHLVSQFQQLSVRSSELPTVQYHTHKSTSKLTTTIRWTYQNDQTRVDSWKLRVRNLTWEQNDYDYDMKKFKYNGDVNEGVLPLWFRPGNRYEVTVYGRQNKKNRSEVVCKKSIEFRTGEMLSKPDVIRLQEAAKLYNERPSEYKVAKCTYFYRNKPKKYFDEISCALGGIMETYLKDASGDLRSPINGEICGLFFCANVNRHGQPFLSSPFGDTRLLIRALEVLRLTPNMFFVDFYCMQNNQDIHHVTIVLTKSGSSADQFCNRYLPRLDIKSNPFLYEEDGRVWVSSAVFVDVFVTEDLNVKNMIDRKIAEMEYNVPTRGLGKTSQGGDKGVKTNGCQHCDIFSNRLLADNPDGYEVY